MSAEKIIQLEMVVPNETRYLCFIGSVAEAVARVLENYSGDRDALAYHLNLVVTEAMANVIEHAGPRDRKHALRVCLYLENNDLTIHVHDQGEGFDIDAVPPPDFGEPSERGRGIFLIRSLMDGVDYQKTEGGNVLVMRKKLR